MTDTTASTPSNITAHEMQQISDTNTPGRQPVVFIHGLWLLPSSWDRWQTVFSEAGYATLAPGWPDDPETVDEAKAHPEVFAHKSISDVADHVDQVPRRTERHPSSATRSAG